MSRTSSSECSHAGPARITPALLTHTSSGPCSAAARAAARCCSGSRTSSRIDAPPISSATAATPSSSTSVASTKCPRRASRAAIARPKPRPAPVTTATPRIARAYSVRHGDRGCERAAALLRGPWRGRAAPVRGRPHVRHAGLDPAGPGLLGGPPDGDLRQPRRRPVVDGGRATTRSRTWRRTRSRSPTTSSSTPSTCSACRWAERSRRRSRSPAPERVRTLTLAVTFARRRRLFPPAGRRLERARAADQPRAARGRADAAEPLRALLRAARTWSSSSARRC